MHARYRWSASMALPALLALASTPVGAAVNIDSLNPAITASDVSALAVQPDGRIVIGGYFTSASPAHNYLARLNADGSFDTTFNPYVNGRVDAVAVQGDGKLIIAGALTSVNGAARSYVARLKADGTLDTAFVDPHVVATMSWSPPAASHTVAWPIDAIAVQADGRIVLGGVFYKVGGAAHANIVRLNADGSVDAGFNAGADGNSVQAVTVQPDGKVLAGGFFTQVHAGTDAMPRQNVARFNGDGTLDRAFDAGTGLNAVSALTLQADGKILAGIDSAPAYIPPSAYDWDGPRIARLNSDGTPDPYPSFDYSGRRALVQSIALQTDGNMYVAGLDVPVNGFEGSPRLINEFSRQYADGSNDVSLYFSDATVSYGAAYVHDEPRGLALQPDGRILLAGLFLNVADTTRNQIARFVNDGVATQYLYADSHSSIRWNRSGASPELARATFELSTDGITYTNSGCWTDVPSQFVTVDAMSGVTLREYR